MGASSRDLDFSEYFAARVQRFRRVAFALCGDWHGAEDLVQAMFVQLYRRWRRVRPDTADAYARRVLLNLFLAGRRKSGREYVTPSPPEAASPPGRDTPLRLDVERALAGLTPRQRAMVVLRFLEDLPVAEVAALLRVAEGTVKSQTARGVEALRAALPAPTSEEW
ncbi:SigE family RNA polymerase sigma factor [Amycolatopsis sp. SID8362]|uniref:SigE family RNA polymerase sigma factor n=1 Tax=Amycolatopsis sp. SID8362 TaxID=2690346 RepID=UPI00136CDA2B|nr:SigE family RNA polymerase sigma factor [Amycolatopsis sp. SID8362]NBH09821.1 SigE family RNA polymerase sigma factor [Amycolatopsis sp. SID8362]NED46514.1 SigE family RNA polymerase sigma factor [Amycolatopsis sp. SID8362]